MVSTPFPMGAAQQSMFSVPFSPVRTPMDRTQSTFQMQQPTDVKYSAKHTGLYLYLIRLLRPIWKKKCVDINKLESTLSYAHCSEILSELYALKAFLEDVPLCNYSEFSPTNLLNNEYTHPSAMHQRNSIEQAAVDDEKRSINALSLFISMSLTTQHILLAGYLCVQLITIFQFVCPQSIRAK